MASLINTFDEPRPYHARECSLKILGNNVIQLELSSFSNLGWTSFHLQQATFYTLTSMPTEVLAQKC